MGIKLGIIMFICIVPFLFMVFFVCYPKKWLKKKLIFGVRSRDEFKENELMSKVDEIVQRNRKHALWILIVSVIISAALIFIPDISVMLTIYTIYLMLIIVVIYIPYAKGNSELKNLKREIGIEAKGIRVADLKSISASHALNMPMLLLPNIATAVVTIGALLYDLELFKVPHGNAQGSFIATMVSMSFFFMGGLFVFIARLMDNGRNEVISKESDVNSNFNRAKKKIWSDLWIEMSWVNTIMLIMMLVSIVGNLSEKYIIIMAIVYMAALFVVIGIVARKTALLNGCYKFENTLDDDDDNWIYGMFYYNPKDGRVNVERRDGLGFTINMAHPIGKIVSILAMLLLIGTFAALFWAAAVSSADLEVRIEDGKVICHQLTDDYVIDENDILEVYLGDDMDELRPIRIAGVATDNVLKGNFAVGDVKKAKLFINPEVDLYIRITTDNNIYFINCNSEEETRELYEEMK